MNQTGGYFGEGLFVEAFVDKLKIFRKSVVEDYSSARGFYHFPLFALGSKILMRELTSTTSKSQAISASRALPKIFPSPFAPSFIFVR